MYFGFGVVFCDAKTLRHFCLSSVLAARLATLFRSFIFTCIFFGGTYVLVDTFSPRGGFRLLRHFVFISPALFSGGRGLAFPPFCAFAFIPRIELSWDK